jgi:hypothetical protein
LEVFSAGSTGVRRLLNQRRPAQEAGGRWLTPMEIAIVFRTVRLFLRQQLCSEAFVFRDDLADSHGDT